MAAQTEQHESSNGSCTSRLSESSSNISTDLHKTQVEGDEGMLNRRFNSLMSKCLQKIMVAGRQDKLNSCFASIHKQNPEIFKSTTEQFMQALRTNIEKEIELMIKQEDLEYLFSKLSQIISESQSTSEPAWRPSGDPSEDTRNHVMKVKMKYKEQLSAMLEKLEEENASLKKDVLQKREKLLASEKKIVSLSSDLAEAAEDLNTGCLVDQIDVLGRK